MFKLKIPPPAYGLLSAGLMWLLAHFLPLADIIDPSWNKFAYIFIGVAMLIATISIIDFLQHKTTINPLQPEQAQKLVTSKAYRYTRNPMYLGLLLLLIGWAILLGSLSPFFVLPIFVMLITTQQIIPEETCLEAKFGEDYMAYKKSVRRWL